MIKQLFVLFALSVVPAVHAQDTPPPKPQAPFLSALPVTAAWRIDYRPLVQVSGGANKTKTSVSTVRNDRCRRDTTTFSDQTQVEAWIFGKMMINRDKTAGTFTVGPAGGNGPGKDYPEFPDLGWIDLEHFKSVETMNGEPCFLYRWDDPAAPPLLPAGTPSEKNAEAYNAAVAAIGGYQLEHPFVPLEPTTVWISVASKLPVALEDKHFKAVYVYNLPVPDLTPPADFQKIIEMASFTQKRIQGQQMVLPPRRR